MKSTIIWTLFAAFLLAPGQATLASESQSLNASLTIAEKYTLGEPIIALLTITNGAGRAVDLDLGTNYKDNLVLLFKTPAGPRSAACLKEESYQVFDRFGAIGHVTLKPGEAFSESLVLNDWHCFDQIGEYELQVLLPTPQVPAPAQSEPVVVSSHFRLTPRDPASLNAACRRLEVTVLSKDQSPVGTLPSRDDAARSAAHALGFVSDDTCIPSLLSVVKANALRRGDALRGLARIGSLLAVEAIVSVWEMLSQNDRETASLEFQRVELGPQLRNALERAGKAIRE
jgi:hypothetical protein